MPILRVGHVVSELHSESHIKNTIWEREVKTSADKPREKAKKCTKFFYVVDVLFLVPSLSF